MPLCLYNFLLIKKNQKLLTTTNECRSGVNGIHFNQLEGIGVAELEKPFSEEELLSALRSSSRDKALGPNGFTMQVKFDILDELLLLSLY